MTGVLARYTGVWVLSRTPALSVPIGFVEDMPVAMQLIGRPFEEGAAAARGGRLPVGDRLAPAPAGQRRLGRGLVRGRKSDIRGEADLPQRPQGDDERRAQQRP